MSKRLEDLDPRFRPLAEELLRRIKQAGIKVAVIDTLRTEAEHQQNLKNGTSNTKRSKHCDGLAIDIAPIECMKLKNWAPGHPLWLKIGLIGEALGLRWGGRWGKPYDPGHFELVNHPPSPQSRSGKLPCAPSDDSARPKAPPTPCPEQAGSTPPKQ